MKKEREQHQQDGGTASAAAAFGSDPEGGAAAEAGGAGALGGGEGGAADAAALAGKNDDGSAIRDIYQINGMSPRMFNHTTEPDIQTHTPHTHIPTHTRRSTSNCMRMSYPYHFAVAHLRDPHSTLSITRSAHSLSLLLSFFISLYTIFIFCIFAPLFYTLLNALSQHKSNLFPICA